jgi:hypothetical protein
LTMQIVVPHVALFSTQRGAPGRGRRRPQRTTGASVGNILLTFVDLR